MVHVCFRLCRFDQCPVRNGSSHPLVSYFSGGITLLLELCRDIRPPRRMDINQATAYACAESSATSSSSDAEPEDDQGTGSASSSGANMVDAVDQGPNIDPKGREADLDLGNSTSNSDLGEPIRPTRQKTNPGIVRDGATSVQSTHDGRPGSESATTDQVGPEDQSLDGSRNSNASPERQERKALPESGRMDRDPRKARKRVSRSPQPHTFPHQRIAAHVLAEVAEDEGSRIALVTHPGTLAMLVGCLSHADPQVRVGAAQAVSWLCAVPTKESRRRAALDAHLTAATAAAAAAAAAGRSKKAKAAAAAALARAEAARAAVAAEDNSNVLDMGSFGWLINKVISANALAALIHLTLDSVDAARYVVLLRMPSVACVRKSEMLLMQHSLCFVPGTPVPRSEAFARSSRIAKLWSTPVPCQCWSGRSPSELPYCLHDAFVGVSAVYQARFAGLNAASFVLGRLFRYCIVPVSQSMGRRKRIHRGHSGEAPQGSTGLQSQDVGVGHEDSSRSGRLMRSKSAGSHMSHQNPPFHHSSTHMQSPQPLKRPTIMSPSVSSTPAFLYDVVENFEVDQHVADEAETKHQGKRLQLHHPRGGKPIPAMALPAGTQKKYPKRTGFGGSSRFSDSEPAMVQHSQFRAASSGASPHRRYSAGAKPKQHAAFHDTEEVEVQNADIASDILHVLTHVCRGSNPPLRVRREIGGRVVAHALVELGILDPLEVILISSRTAPYAGGLGLSTSHTPRTLRRTRLAQQQFQLQHRLMQQQSAFESGRHVRPELPQHIPLTTTLELLYRLTICPENRVEILSRGRILRELFVHIKRTTEKQQRILRENSVRSAESRDEGSRRGSKHQQQQISPRRTSDLHSNADAEAQLYIGGFFANTMKARSAVVLAAPPSPSPDAARSPNRDYDTEHEPKHDLDPKMRRRSSDTVLIRRLDAQKEAELLLHLLWLAQYPARQNTEVSNHALEALAILAEDFINWRFYRRTLELPYVDIIGLMGWVHAVPIATAALSSLNPKVVFQATRLLTALALMSQRLQDRIVEYRGLQTLSSLYVFQFAQAPFTFVEECVTLLIMHCDHHCGFCPVWSGTNLLLQIISTMPTYANKLVMHFWPSASKMALTT